MTWKLALFIVLCIVAALLIVWVALKAINGIRFEIETLMRCLGER